MGSSIVPAAVLACAALVAVMGMAVARAFVAAQPDEWLLCIRNGRLVRAGVGISLWRRPGDVVVRFTSTVQRVGFAATAVSGDRLPVVIEGFILWSVAPDGESAFRAFSKLGLANLDAPGGGLKSDKHLLSTPQHHAFQKLLAAMAQRLAARRSLEELLVGLDNLVEALRAELAALEAAMGIRVDGIEILQVRPSDPELLEEMSAEVVGQVREEAARVRLEAEERGKRREIESEARVAEQQAEARRQGLERDKHLRLDEIAHAREVALRQEEVAREQELAAEARALEVARAAVEREELALSARLDGIRREAAAGADAVAALAAAEERKSPGLRDHEIGKLVVEKVGDALKGLPIHDARWITMGGDSPAASLAGMIAAVREAAAGSSGGPA